MGLRFMVHGLSAAHPEAVADEAREARDNAGARAAGANLDYIRPPLEAVSRRTEAREARVNAGAAGNEPDDSTHLVARDI